MDAFDSTPASVHSQAFIYNLASTSSLGASYLVSPLSLKHLTTQTQISDPLLRLYLDASRGADSILAEPAKGLAGVNSILFEPLSLLARAYSDYLAVILGEFRCSSHEDVRLDSCIGLIKFHEYMITTGQLIIGSCLLLRTYALYGRTRRISGVLGVVAIAEIVYVLWKSTAGPSNSLSGSDFEGCLLPLDRQASSDLGSLWISLLCFDVLIFGLTLYKALEGWHAGATSVLKVMLRDGTIYFGVMIIIAISGIIDFKFFPSYLRGVTATYGNVLSTVMVSRLMLNLRDPKLRFIGDSRAEFTTELGFRNNNNSTNANTFELV
ncbi:hypothetical protein GALMADRAFT_161116 [Galerina marginata CBS 339.88]|uniref:Uncharacterized protein n=1 Tax=Galerina marginata (strain CBS 339.88) TaxID=685588 RepID=A0A067SBD7_GALM3|nr:hypothetical protein GALMADRAFT_161116 [Galerina marginata CBS 339.88]